MNAARIHQFGPPEVIVIDDIPHPSPQPNELLIRVAAAGVGPWDALIREKKSVVNVPLPIILGSDLAGTVEAVGAETSAFKPGDEVYGVTNPNFCGAYCEYAVVQANMVALKPKSLSFIEAASAPVVAVTAWQMLFDYAQAQSGQSILIHGAAGNVGAYAVQLAKQAGIQVFATAGSDDLDRVRALGADTVIDYKKSNFEDRIGFVDAVLDLVGGEDTQRRSMAVIKPGGILVSVVSPIPEESQPSGIRSAFFLVEVTTTRLNLLTQMFENRTLATQVGSVLPLTNARVAHEMLGGAPHQRGKIVLRVPS